MKLTKYTTSKLEIRDLIKAWSILSLAFAILLSRGFDVNFFYTLILSCITVGFGFILHELGHKFMAQRFGYKAEFRAFDEMLFLALIMSFFGFIFAAPGATMIFTKSIREKYNGIISVIGPIVNLILASLFILILYFITFDFSLVVNILRSPFNLSEMPLKYAIPFVGFLVNSWLALFNMIPFWLFDGKKVFKWNKFVYFLVLAIALFFVFGI